MKQFNRKHSKLSRFFLINGVICSSSMCIFGGKVASGNVASISCFVDKVNNK